MNVSKFLYRFRSITDRSKRYSERHFKVIAAIGAFSIPGSTLIESAVVEPAFNTIYIRGPAGLLALPFLFHDKLPATIQRNLDWLWVLVLALVLPFCFGSILTLNAALTEPDQELSSIWVYQYLVAIFIFVQLVHHGPLAAFLWVIASLVALALCLGVTPRNWIALQEAWLYPMPVYLTALLVGSVTNRNIHMVQAEQLRAAAAIGSNIAHELRTPLASIRLFARGIGRFLPDLVDGYEKAKALHVQLAPISDRQLEQLREGLESIQAEVTYSNTIIDMLLINTSDSPVSTHGFERFQISGAIEEAVARFPFNNSTERELLRQSIVQDFAVFAPRPLIVHVFFNLIKNALFFVQKGRNGLILITASTRKGRGVVEVVDSGIGIPANVQPLIFDRFYSSGPATQGAGIGLSFCKMVMKSIGGDIQVESEEGRLTTFRLIFPEPKR